MVVLAEDQKYKLLYNMVEGAALLSVPDMLVLKYSHKIENEKVLAYLDQLVTLAEQRGVRFVFLPLSTATGMQVIILSHYFEYNLVWVDLMLKLCSTVGFVADAYLNGM